MDITYVAFEHKLIITKDNQQIEVTPFILREEHGNIKLGIHAPKGIEINREEIYLLKQKKKKASR